MWWSGKYLCGSEDCTLLINDQHSIRKEIETCGHESYFHSTHILASSSLNEWKRHESPRPCRIRSKTTTTTVLPQLINLSSSQALSLYLNVSAWVSAKVQLLQWLGESVHQQQQRVSIVIRQARQSGEPTHIHSRPSWNRLKFQLIISGRNTKFQQLNPFLGRSIGISGRSAGDGRGGLLLSSEGSEGGVRAKWQQDDGTPWIQRMDDSTSIGDWPEEVTKKPPKDREERTNFVQLINTSNSREHTPKRIEWSSPPPPLYTRQRHDQFGIASRRIASSVPPPPP